MEKALLRSNPAITPPVQNQYQIDNPQPNQSIHALDKIRSPFVAGKETAFYQDTRVGLSSSHPAH